MNSPYGAFINKLLTNGKSSKDVSSWEYGILKILAPHVPKSVSGLVCPICGKRYTNYRAMKAHYMSVIPRCASIMKMLFTNLRFLAARMQEITKKRTYDYRCRICGKVYPYREDIIQHVISAHSDALEPLLSNVREILLRHFGIEVEVEERPRIVVRLVEVK